MKDEDFEVLRNGMAGCGMAGCIIYLMMFLLFIIGLVVFAFFSTPNPFG